MIIHFLFIYYFFTGDNWKEGEVLVSNHPSAGGSHLPDITVITPVRANSNIISFFVILIYCYRYTIAARQYFIWPAEATTQILVELLRVFIIIPF